MYSIFFTFGNGNRKKKNPGIVDRSVNISSKYGVIVNFTH